MNDETPPKHRYMLTVIRVDDNPQYDRKLLGGEHHVEHARVERARHLVHVAHVIGRATHLLVFPARGFLRVV